METALEIIARIGGDNPPSLEELSSARDTIARELHALKGTDNVDLEALMSLRETYAVVAEAITAAQADAEKAAEGVESILDGIPDPDAEPESLETTEEPAKVLSLREAVARLGLVEEAAPVVESVTEREPDLATTKTTVRFGSKIAQDATWKDMTEAFKEAASSLKAGKERVIRISTEYASDRFLPGNPDDNTRLIDAFVSPEAVSAAGGCCSLPTPIYENPVVGSTSRPIRDSLPTFGATRGAVTFYPAICIPQAGSGVWTCEDDAAVDPEDPDTWKECAEVDCDDSDTVQVKALYRCITVGNYQARFNPERWEGILKALLVTQARNAEVALFDEMRALATSTHTGLATGSTYLNIVNTAIRATALMRQDERLEDVDFNLWLPTWALGAAVEGFGINRLDKGGALDDVRASITQALAGEGIRTHWSLDIDDLESEQYDGALADYPATASAMLAPEGYYSFLDGGQFDLGTEIRDHDLNRQNKVAAFAESFEGLMARGCNAKALDIPIECDLTMACPS